MRIAQVTATFPPNFSGTGMVCFQNAVGLAELGHKVSVFTYIKQKSNLKYPDSIQVHHLPSLFSIGNAPFLPDLVKLRDFDIIHLHHPFIFGSEKVCIASRWRKIPYIVTHHNDLISNGVRGKLFALYSLLCTPLVFSGARRCAVVSRDHALHGTLASLFRKYSHKTVEIHNGVDVNLFKPDLNGGKIRWKCGISENDKVLLFVGVLDSAHHYRRVDLLIKSIKQINQDKLHLLIVGTGDRETYYRNLVSSLNLDSKVHFLGRVQNSELPLVYAASDVVVLPSHIQEAFPLVLLEAMACGKPIIASDLPGVRTMIDCENGLLVQPGDLNDLTRKIENILWFPEVLKHMGMKGRAKVEKEYSWPVINDLLENLYHQILT